MANSIWPVRTIDEGIELPPVKAGDVNQMAALNQTVSMPGGPAFTADG
jgi:hypothetical protein